MALPLQYTAHQHDGYLFRRADSTTVRTRTPLYSVVHWWWYIPACFFFILAKLAFFLLFTEMHNLWAMLKDKLTRCLFQNRHKEKRKKKKDIFLLRKFPSQRRNDLLLHLHRFHWAISYVKVNLYSFRFFFA